MKTEKYYFEKTYELAKENYEKGEDPFACVLVDEEGEIIEWDVSQGEAIDKTSHDVMSLVRKCAKKYDREYLSKCTIYCLCEPCVMCSAAMFWCGFRKVVFELEEKELNEMLPGGLSISSNEFCNRAPVLMESIGPYKGLTKSRELVKEWADKILAN